MNYHIIINIGDQNMLSYISTSLLFQFFKREEVLLYFFEENYSLPIEDKLSLVFTEVNFMLNDNRDNTFNIIYFDSSYDSLLEKGVEGAGLHIIGQKINVFISKYDKIASKNSINQLLIYHSPWYDQDDIIAHENKITKFKSEINSSLKSNNKLIIRNFSIHDEIPERIPFYKICRNSIEFIVEIINDNKFFINPDLYHNNKITKANAGFTNEQIQEYKFKLEYYLVKLNKDTTITSELYSNTDFWSDKLNENDEIGFEKTLFENLYKIDFPNFNSYWAEFITEINSSIGIMVRKLIQNNKFGYSFTNIVPENSEEFSIKPEGNNTSRNILDNKIKILEKDAKHSKMDSLKVVAKPKDIKNSCKEKLERKKTTLKNIVRKLPNKESINVFYLIIVLTTIIPLISMTYLLRWDTLLNLTPITFLMLFMLSLSLFIYLFIFKRAFIKTFYSLIDGIEQSILIIFNNAKDRLKQEKLSIIKTLNNYTYANYNYNILVNEIKLQFEEADKVKNNKIELITNILLNSELQDIAAADGQNNNYQHKDLDDNFFTSISIDDIAHDQLSAKHE